MKTKVIKLRSGFQGKIVERFHQGHGDIRPPFTLKGGFKLQGINGYFGFITVLPPEIKKTLYPGEVLYSEIEQ
jgi:hypothetical protein